MNKQIIDTINKQYPPASVNNSRRYVLRKIEQFNRNPSEKLAREIENLTGLTADFRDADHGITKHDII